MSRLIAAFRSRYGAGPLHLIGLLAMLAITGAALFGWFAEPAISIKYILIWFVGAILLHDMLLLPLYSAIDRLALSFRRGGGGRAPTSAPVRSPGWVYVRVPLLLSGLLFLVFAPEILRLGDSTFQIASGRTQHVYLARYLLIVAVLFTLSGLAYVGSRARASSRIP